MNKTSEHLSLTSTCIISVQQVDAFACSKLDMVEKSYPIISAPTEVVLKEGRERCEAVLRPVTDRYNYYRGAYTGMVNRSKETVRKSIFIVVYSQLSLCVRKQTIWVPTRSDANQPVQSQKQACVTLAESSHRNPVGGKACSSTKGGLLRCILNTYSIHKVSSLKFAYFQGRLSRYT